MAELIDVDYPEEVRAGQKITILVTVDFWIGTDPEGLFVCIQDMDDYKNPEAVGAPWPSHYILEQREPLGPLPRGPSTKTYSLTYDVPLYAKKKIALAVEAYLLYRGSLEIKDWQLRRVDKEIFEIAISSEIGVSGDLLTNGGFDQGTLGWKPQGNETPPGGNIHITVFGLEGKGLSVNFQKTIHRYILSSSISQIVYGPVPLGLKLSFWTKIEPFYVVVNPATLTQLSLEFEGAENSYRINYLVTKCTGSIVYRDRLENEKNIFVTKESPDWQFIERDVENDFLYSFGSREQSFDKVNVIIEQASTTSSAPIAYFDTVSLTKKAVGMDFSLSVSPNKTSVKQSEKIVFDVEVNPIKNFDQSVTLAVSGLPNNVPSVLTVTSDTPPFKSALTMNASSMQVGNYPITISASGGGITHSETVALIVEKGTKQQSSLTISASYQGGKITVTGFLSPSLDGSEIILTYNSSDGGKITRKTSVGSDGSFKDVYAPGTSGTWSVEAEWKGSENHMATRSQPISLTAQSSAFDLDNLLSNPLYLILIFLAIIILALVLVLMKKKKIPITKRSEKPTKYCMNCGKSLQSGKKFCTSCGERAK